MQKRIFIDRTITLRKLCSVRNKVSCHCLVKYIAKIRVSSGFLVKGRAESVKQKINLQIKECYGMPLCCRKCYLQ